MLPIENFKPWPIELLIGLNESERMHFLPGISLHLDSQYLLPLGVQIQTLDAMCSHFVLKIQAECVHDRENGQRKKRKEIELKMPRHSEISGCLCV